MRRPTALSAFAVVLSLAALAPAAQADVIFSQPPKADFTSVTTGDGAAFYLPFVAPSNAHMSGLSFWAWNLIPDQPLSIRLFAEAGGGGVGAELHSAVVQLASLDAAATQEDHVSKYTYHLPASQMLFAGDRYFIETTGHLAALYSVLADSGEGLWINKTLPTDSPIAFEILGEPANAIPLPSGALMGLAALGLVAGVRRRR